MTLGGFPGSAWCFSWSYFCIVLGTTSPAQALYGDMKHIGRYGGFHYTREPVVLGESVLWGEVGLDHQMFLPTPIILCSN